jgi:Rv2525c-like, glycoside hydrolase-like domain/Putative peptidoglycan binding domain
MIIDTNLRTTSKLDSLKTSGVDTIIRYYCRNTRDSNKQVTRAEAAAITRAGLKLGIVYQGAGNKAAAFSSAMGAADGKYAFEYAAKTIGQPAGSAIYFAVDYDASAADIRDRIIPYFRAVAAAGHASAGPDYRVGVYGSGAVCQALLDANLVSLTWVSMSAGFSNTRAFLRSQHWTLHQKLETRVSGMDVDTNELNDIADGFGEFSQLDDSPGSSDLSETQVEALQRALTERGYPLGAIDGIFGSLTAGALLGFKRDQGLPTTPVVDAATWAALGKPSQRPLARDRMRARPRDVRNQGSRIIADAGSARLAALLSSILGALGIGNSAVVGLTHPSVDANRLIAFLKELKPLLQGDKLLKSTQLDQLQADASRLLTENLAAVNPAVLQKMPQLDQLLPVDWAAQNQNQLLAHLLQQIGGLPDPNLLTTITHYLPGLGGSVPMLLIGLAGMRFTNQIRQARTRDHVTGRNIGR